MFCFRLGRQRYMIQNCTIYKRIQKGFSRHWRCSFPSPCSHFPSLTLPSPPLPPISLVTIFFNYFDGNIKFVSGVYLHPWTPSPFSILSPMKIFYLFLFDFILLRWYLIHSCPEFVLLSKTCREVAQQASLRRAFAFELFHHDQLKFRLEFAFFSFFISELKES